MDKEKICEVLNEIKRYCDSQGRCPDCIFNDPNGRHACPLDAMPEDWPTFKTGENVGDILYI